MRKNLKNFQIRLNEKQQQLHLDLKNNYYMNDNKKIFYKPKYKNQNDKLEI